MCRKGSNAQSISFEKNETIVGVWSLESWLLTIAHSKVLPPKVLELKIWKCIYVINILKKLQAHKSKIIFPFILWITWGLK